MSEIQSLAAAVEDGLNQPISKPITVRVEESESLAGTFGNETWLGTQTGDQTHVVKVGIKAYVSDATLAQIGSHGLTNPAALAWELFPLSFVIDWFIPIGSFLDGLSTSLGMEFRDGYMTKHFEWSIESAITIVPPPYVCSNNTDLAFHNYAGSMGERWELDQAWSEWGECFDRQIMPFPPPPVPYWDPQLNVSKITSIMTLLTAVIAK